MKTQRLMGPDAGVIKYDILTALSVAGLAGSPGFCTTLMRLIALITARYNWREDEFCVGQRDMARMWSVDERTVKRQIKRLLETDLLVCKRPGVRGRVGAYRLNQSAIARLSEPNWALVGPDFEKRMQDRYRVDDVKVVQFNAYGRADHPEYSIPPGRGTTPWDRVSALLETDDPALFSAWFARLSFTGQTGDTVQLACPSAFIQRYIETHLMARLLRAIKSEFGADAGVTFKIG